MARTPAQEALVRAFMRRTLRLRSADALQLGVPETERCGLTINSGGTVAGDGRTQARGDFTLKLPADTLMSALPEGAKFTIDGERGIFVITWAPPATNLNLARRYDCNRTS